ncbi:MAG: hypothetical protein ACHBN1_12725 [Heteroscytonema crispum UTEX LB 1556]
MRSRATGVGRRVWGDGCGGTRRTREKFQNSNAQCPIPNAQFPTRLLPQT